MKNKHHLPHIDDLFDQLQGACVFWKIDLRFVSFDNLKSGGEDQIPDFEWTRGRKVGF